MIQAMIEMKFDPLSFQLVTKKKFGEEDVSYRLSPPPPPPPQTKQQQKQKQQQQNVSSNLKLRRSDFIPMLLLEYYLSTAWKKVCCLLLLLISFVYRYSPLSSRFTVLVSHVIFKGDDELMLNVLRCQVTY